MTSFANDAKEISNDGFKESDVTMVHSSTGESMDLVDDDENYDRLVNFSAAPKTPKVPPKTSRGNYLFPYIQQFRVS
jgi:hypothetical protein